jgi:taurine dioxygenase
VGQLLEHRRLSTALGIEIVGLDLRRELTGEQTRELVRLMGREHLLVFRGQQLTADDQIRVIGQFGEVDDECGDGLKSYLISNARSDGQLGEVALAFHSDWTWTTVPVVVASLYAETVGGPCVPTRFSNAARAFEALPEDLKARLAGRLAVHLNYRPTVMRTDYSTRLRLADLPADASLLEAPRASHPVVLADPFSGASLLFVNEYFTSHIIDMPLEESEALLTELFGRLRAPDNIYEHPWEEGDLVVWNNLAVQHGRRAFVGLGAHRTLRRVSTSENGLSPMTAVGLSTA